MQVIREFAPIIIPTLNRYEHFKRCVESLLKCTHADKTELIVGLDYPPSSKYIEGWQKISSYLDSLSGFRKITILRTEVNLGATENINRCRNYARQYYNTYIATEDDNEFSPCFLDYINKVLTKYWDDERIIAVSGYNYPIDMGKYSKSIYAYHQFSAWGVGRWFHKLEYVHTSFASEIMHSPSKIIKILTVEANLLCVLMRMIASKQRWGDALIVSNNIITKRYSIFPTISLARNHGHDGSGLHCDDISDDNIYSCQTISNEYEFQLEEIPIEELNLYSLKQYFRPTFKEMLLSTFNYIKFLLTK